MTVRPLSASVWLELAIERDRQDASEEFGEVCRAWLERDTDELRAELIQTAAVALAWIEELDNGGSRERAV